MKKFLTACLLSITTLAGAKTPPTTTPIKYLVIIFQENRTFDHYFGTYPYAQNNPGETKFNRKRNTPSVNGLTSTLQTLNQNLDQPFRVSPSEANLCAPGHDYALLQESIDRGLNDAFVQTTGAEPPPICGNKIMAYFDGNSVTALWNYAQVFSMSDNFHATGIAPSTLGAINLISGQTSGASPANIVKPPLTLVLNGTIVNDIDPKYDKCSLAPTVELSGKNVGNLLNEKGITWGFFEAGFADCNATHPGPTNLPVIDYVAHHNPFQYYQSTSNPDHLPPSSPKMIGKTDQANHQYDISDFWTAMESGNLPSVSILKASHSQDGHPGTSTPLMEQLFIVPIINKLQTLPQWKEMAIIIAYDDSGGWYDHEVPTIINDSQTALDNFSAVNQVGTNSPLGTIQGRPGYGFRVPCLVISPWAKENYVDSSLTDQTSILRFIEDNWSLGRIGDSSFDAYAAPITNMFNFHERKLRYLFLNPTTGAIEYKSD